MIWVPTGLPTSSFEPPANIELLHSIFGLGDQTLPPPLILVLPTSHLLNIYIHLTLRLYTILSATRFPLPTNIECIPGRSQTKGGRRQNLIAKECKSLF